jgi:hypothetical protein
MWPVKGRYQCPTCLRSYPVLWERLDVVPSRKSQVVIPNKEAALPASTQSAAVAAAVSR